MAVPGRNMEIDVLEVALKRKGPQSFVLLDVREPDEVARVNLGPGVEVVPLSRLAMEQLAALPAAAQAKDAEIIVFCHHAMRSLRVAHWLAQQGWTNVRSMAGGIDAYARQVDPSIGRY
jgi:rhodanese-related sulfurtransferase